MDENKKQYEDKLLELVEALDNRAARIQVANTLFLFYDAVLLHTAFFLDIRFQQKQLVGFYNLWLVVLNRFGF